MPSLLLCLMGVACMLKPAVIEPGWPQWRGPTHDGISAETGLANSWPNDGPPVLWVKEIGQGYSAFVAAGDRVYTQTQTLYEQTVLCLEADTGRQVWSYRYGWPYDGGGLYPGPRATPAWHDGRVYFAAPDGNVGCLNATDGRHIWSRNLKQEYHGRGTDFGCASSPLIVAGKVIVPVGGGEASVVAVDAQTGKTVWTAGDLAASYCTPVPITFQGRQLVVAFMENSMSGFDVETGRRLWNIEFSQGYDEHAAAPLYREPDLFIASPFHSGAKLYRITKLEQKNDSAEELKLEMVWENMKFSNDVASSILLDGHIYGFDLKDAQSRLNRPSRGEFRCLDFMTGKAKWSSDKVGQANIIAADGKLILFNDNGELILARADSNRYEELARTTVFRDEVCWTPPALHRGRLYLRTQLRAVCLYLGDKPLNSATTAIPQTTAAVSNLRPRRWFNASSLLGGEREFPATTPEWDEFHLWHKWSLCGIALGVLVGLIFLAIRELFQRMWVGKRIGMFFHGVARSEIVTEIDSHPPGTPGRGAGGEGQPSVAQLPHHQPSSKPPECGGEGSRNLESPFAKSETPSGPIGSAQSPTAHSARIVYWRIGFWLTVTVCGMVGSAQLNSRLDDYVFTWPLALWSVFQMTLMTISWSERQSNKRRARWWSRGAGLLLIASSAFYFHVCRSLALSIEWSYLLGYLPAFPIVALCARPLISRHRFWLLTDPIVAVGSFSFYFWACAWFMKWWLVVGS